jgi:large subunit ribosomal protein L9
MEVVLLDKVSGLGVLGDKVQVKSGYGRNFLIPNGKAVFATKENVAAFEARREELEKEAAGKLTVAEVRKAAIDGMDAITITHKAGEEGKLFGSVGTADIAKASIEAGVKIIKSELRLPKGAFRQAGEYEVVVHLYPEVDATLKINILGEE